MSSLQHRSQQLEIMDDLSCAGAVVNQTLRELDFINQWLGGNAVTLQALRKVWGKSRKTSIAMADLGCGSGEMLRVIASHKSFRGISFQLYGWDANPNIITYAREHCREFSNIQFFASNVFDSAFQSLRFDVTLATLFLHHFTNDEIVKLLLILKSNTSTAIVINDLHRHPLAYYSIWALTKLFSKSSMVKYDAPLSVARGFSRKEWVAILKDAGIDRYELNWRWAFRWQLIIWL